jgi:tetratricopeptide (TPR) repeat protein
MTAPDRSAPPSPSTCTAAAARRRAAALSIVLLAMGACGIATSARAQGAAEAAPAADASVPVAPVDLALIEGSIARLAAAARERADRALGAKSYPAALAALQEAHELDPAHARSALRLAELYALLGNDARAEQTYRAALALDPGDVATHVGLAELLARDAGDAARLSEAASLLARARELGGNDPAILLRQARVAAASGSFEQAELAYRTYLRHAPESDEIRIEIGDLHRDFGQPDRALAWYRKVGPAKAAARLAAQRMFDLDVEREARELGLAQKGEPISEQARALADKSRLLRQRGELAEAEQLARRALSLSPAFALARADLGDVLRARGRAQEAELEYLRGLAIAPTQWEIHVRLAELYLDPRSGERASEAALILERALRARGDLPVLHLHLARAYQRAGDLPRALFHANRFLAQAPAGPDRDGALELQQTLARLLVQEPAAVPAHGSAAATRSGASPLARARAHLARGQTDAALAELRRLPEAGRSADVLELEGRVLHAAGRLREAARVLAASLARDRRQLHAQAELGRVLYALGQRKAARSHFAECELRGHAECSFELARADAGADRGALSFAVDAPRLFALLSARERLGSLLGSGALHAQRAELSALRARVDERLLALALAAVLLLACALAATLLLRARVFGGIDVATLIERRPEAGPEAMRILSAIRHEVLKHNTMALAGLCQALRRGEPAADKAAHLDRALFGADGAGEGGAGARLLGYADQLRQLGRAHGLRVNLEHRDGALGPLLAGFSRLYGARGALRGLDRLGPRARRRLLGTLERAVAALHERGYAGLRATLDRIRFFRVDAAVLHAVFERTRAEPAFAGAAIAPLELDAGDALPCSVAMPAHAFAEVMTNLMRNAIAATLAASPRTASVFNRQGAEGAKLQNSGGSDLGVSGALAVRPSSVPAPASTVAATAVQIGLRVRVEADAVTGLTRIAFAVCDRARGALPEGALRSRYIEAGLGLTADLVARYEGSLDVQPEPGWSKAVVLRLPDASESESHS